MKLLLFVCAIWTGAYIDPSDGVGVGFFIGRYMKHLQERTATVDCKETCNLKEIRTLPGKTGMTLVKGLTMENNEFCTSDWSLGSGPGNTAASSQICKFDKSVEKPTTGSFLIKLLCVNWKNTNQGCQFGMLYIELDGDLVVKGYKDTYPWYMDNIAHKQSLTYKCDCGEKEEDRECVEGRIRTKSDAGYVSIAGYTDEGENDEFCTSDWPPYPFAGPRNPVPVSGDEICTVDGDKPEKGSSFYLTMSCFNFYDTKKGCTNTELIIDGFDLRCTKK